MKEQLIRVTFQPQGRAVSVLRGGLRHRDDETREAMSDSAVSAPRIVLARQIGEGSGGRCARSPE